MSQSWKLHESKDFWKFAISYAAGKDIILDEQLTQNEIMLDTAHVLMLQKQWIIWKEIAKPLLEALQELKQLDLEGNWKMDPELEDVHSNVEKFLTNKTGIEVGGYLRMGIARNDQIYTNTRMYMREKILMIIAQLASTVNVLVNKAKDHTETLMPGYTHLRPSQPITYAHWLLAKAYYFIDDITNLFATLQQVNKSSLWVVQMAGTHLPIDRQMTSDLLGFDEVSLHAQYTAWIRGELEIKVLSDFSLIAVHIRRIMNEMITFSWVEFGMMEIDDMYSTWGTGQPNLKNPDTLEIVRANCSMFYGKLVQSISMMDMLPGWNNRDCQQTKPWLFEAVDELLDMLPIFTWIMDTTEIYEDRMNELAQVNYGIAPDLCMELAAHGKCSFREVYKVIKYLLKKTDHLKTLEDLTTEMFETYSEQELGKKITLSQEVIDTFTKVKHVVLNRNSLWGTSVEQSELMIQDLEKKLAWIQELHKEKTQKIASAKSKLEEQVISFLNW